MKKPVLVTPLASDKVEVIADFKLVLSEAYTEQKEVYNISRVTSEHGMVGSTWLLEAVGHEVQGEILHIKTVTGGKEDEYSFRL